MSSHPRTSHAQGTACSRAGARLASVMLAALAFAAPAFAHQMPNTGATGSNGSNTSSTKTLPSGLTVTFAVAGGTNYAIFDNNTTLGSLGGPTSAMYTPQFATSNAAIELDVYGDGCGTVPVNGSATCSNRGTLTITFSRPVTNPVLHLGGLGGTSTNGSSITSTRAVHVLTGSSPAGATLSLLPGAVNMAVGGGTIDVANPAYVGTSCSALSPGAATQLSGCGSVRVNGTVTSVTFRIDLAAARLGSASSSTPTTDGYVLTVSVDEDFGDAPATYDPTAGTTGAASHMVGGLRLGATIDADNTTVQNPNSPAVQPSPNAVAAGADNNGAAGDGSDEDGLAIPLPILHTGLIGQTWALAPSLSNVGADARVCGWVDFNRNGVFDNPSERACADVAAGATSAALNWTVPLATTAGRSYVRLRVSHDVTGVQSPTGRVDSGEVEDYMLEIKPVVRVVKQLVPTGDAGRFDLQVVGTSFATTVGHNGSTGFRTLYHNSASNAPDVTVATNIQSSPLAVTVAELASSGTALGDYVSTYSCQDGTGAVVASGSATSASVTLPASVVGASANGRQQAVTCTFTNTARPRAELSVTKTNNAASVLSGENTVYTVAFTNNGPNAADGATIRDPAPTGMVCHTVTCAAGNGAVCPAVTIAALQGAGVVVNTLPNGGTLTLQMTCTVN